MKKNILLFTAFCLQFTLFNNSMAQAPLSIPYQAVARNIVGNTIVNQNISLRFSIHDVTSNGSVVYKETQIVTTNSLGLFTANIGQGTVVTGTFATIAWATGAKFLQVEMDPSGGVAYVNMGTQQILSVPYALNSSTSSDNKWNSSSTNISNNNSGNVGIGIATPTAKFHSTGTTRHEGLSGTGIRPVLADPAGNLIIAHDSTYLLGNGTTGAISDNSCIGLARTIALSGLPDSVPSSKISVTVNITHAIDGDLRIYLTSPGGAVLNLAFANGGAGDNFTNSVFIDNAAGFLTSGTAPFTGSFKPTGNMTTVCSVVPTVTTFGSIGGGSINPNGTWTLTMFDQGSNLLAGTFNSWSISIAGAAVNVAGSNNYIPKWSFASLSAVSNIYDNGTSVGIGTTTPAASSMLNIASSNKGVLFPQISLDSLKDVTSVASPANGLVVYNTTQPGTLNDLQRGYYYYSSVALSWIRLADNFNDNVWQPGGLLGVQLKDKTDGVEIMDNFSGSASNYSPKVKILKQVDSTLLNSKNNITSLVLTAVEKKNAAGWESRQKNSLIFENAYILPDGLTSATNSVTISSYTENTGTVASTQTNGLAFYTFATPQNTAVSDTPSMTLFRHNVGIGAYATDINNVTEGRLQITGFSNGDQLSLRHPSSINLKWGFYVSSIDSSLNFYSNGSLRANIDRVTGVFTALSDRKLKKDILNLPAVLNNLLKLPVYSYQYIDDGGSDRRSIGFMAQDVLPYYPELVYKRGDRDTGESFYTLNYDGFGVLAVKAIQEQQQQIDQQKIIVENQQNEIKKLKTEIASFKTLLEEMKTDIGTSIRK